MASRTARVASIDAVRAARAALIEFSAEVCAALDTLAIEAQRPLDWIERDQTHHWPRQVQARSDQLSEARLALQRCELTIDGSQSRYCYDERKALERAKARLREAEEKVQAVKRWRVTIRKEVEEFQVQVEKLRHYLGSDFQQGLVALSKMAEALDRYVEQPAPGATLPQPSAANPGEQLP